jgi:hypothetical protein
MNPGRAFAATAVGSSPGPAERLAGAFGRSGRGWTTRTRRGQPGGRLRTPPAPTAATSRHQASACARQNIGLHAEKAEYYVWVTQKPLFVNSSALISLGPLDRTLWLWR